MGWRISTSLVQVLGELRARGLRVWHLNAANDGVWGRDLELAVQGAKVRLSLFAVDVASSFCLVLSGGLCLVCSFVALFKMLICFNAWKCGGRSFCLLFAIFSLSPLSSSFFLSHF